MENSTVLSVIIPAYLEEENLRFLLPRLNEILQSLSINTEVLVVDTEAPMDHTQEVCEQFQVRYLNRQGGNDFGYAVRTGIREANGKFILFMDGDGSHSPEFIPDLFRYAEDYDVVGASRYIEEGFTENSRLLVLMSRLLNWTYSIILNLDMKDVSNSFKLYRADLLKQTHTFCNKFDIIEEILFKMKRAKPTLKIKEVPFVFKKRMFGETKRNLVLFIVSYLYTLFRLRFSIRSE